MYEAEIKTLEDTLKYCFADGLNKTVIKELSGLKGSLPGQPPGKDSGELIKSIVKTEDGIMITAPYAYDLEYGNFTMAARPFVRPGVDKVINKLAGLVNGTATI